MNCAFKSSPDATFGSVEQTSNHGNTLWSLQEVERLTVKLGVVEALPVWFKILWCCLGPGDPICATRELPLFTDSHDMVMDSELAATRGISLLQSWSPIMRSYHGRRRVN